MRAGKGICRLMNFAIADPPHGPLPRRATIGVRVGEGGAAVTVGGDAPVVVQSMTNTDTADVAATVAQIAALARAGSELVRLTVDRDEAAAAVPHIRDRLRAMGVTAPLIGDFHYIGHKLLADHPACAEALDKYRINPGNVGFKNKRDLQFSQIVEIAIRNGKAVRIGANWGSLDQELLSRLMDENARKSAPQDARAVTREAMVRSALLSAARAEEIGLPARAHHPFGESLRRAGSDRRLPHAWPALGLCAASWPHRGRNGIEGRRRLVGGAGHPPAGGTGRHDPDFAHSRTRGRPDPRSARSRRNFCRPWASAVSRRRSRPAPAAGARRRRYSRNWRATSRAIWRNRCRNGASAIRASNGSTSR